MRYGHKSLVVFFVLLLLFSCAKEDSNDVETLSKEVEALKVGMDKVKHFMRNDLNRISSALRKKKITFQISKKGHLYLRDSNYNEAKYIVDNRMDSYKSLCKGLSQVSKAVVLNTLKSLSDFINYKIAKSFLDEKIRQVYHNSKLTLNEKRSVLAFLHSLEMYMSFMNSNKNMIKNNNYAQSFEIAEERSNRPSWWYHCQVAFSDLTDDIGGKIATAVFAPAMLAVVFIGGTLNYMRQEIEWEKKSQGK